MHNCAWYAGVVNVVNIYTQSYNTAQWRIQDFEKGGSTATQIHNQALPA